MSSSPQQGGPLDAIVDSFMERCRRGERPSIEEYVGQHLELAGEIREVLAAVAMIEEAKDVLTSNTDAWPGVDAAAVTRTLEKLGDYRIVRELGRGGMGIVYEAEQISLGRRVALKVLPAGATLDATRLKRYQREARVAARLHHTNIVPVYGVGQAEGIHFFTMQYLPGHGLDKIIGELSRLRHGGSVGPEADTKRALGESSITDVALSLLTGRSAREAADPAALSPEPIAPQRPCEAPSAPVEHPLPLLQDARYWHNVARIGLQAAEALDYAHAQGMVHRDVKPSNLLLDVHGAVWLTDFGLAKQDDQDNLTQTGDLLGTLRYIAPEGLRGQFDARSDVYSLGLTLYELVGLVPARDGSHREGLLQQLKEGAVPALRRLCPQVPLDLETIIHKALAPAPQRRYQTAGEMAADLSRYLNDEPIRARRVTVVERLARWCRRNPAISVTASAAVLVIAATVLAALLFITAAKNRAERLAEAQGRLAEENAALAQREKEARGQLQTALAGEAQERRRAESHMREAEKARDEQDRAAREARAVSDFLVVDMLGAASPERNYGTPLTVRQMLDRAARRVGTSFSQQPETEAAVRVAIGRAYHSLGLYNEAHEQLTAALKLQRRVLGAGSLATLKTEINLAAVLYSQGKYAEGQKLQEQTLAGLRRNFGPDHPQAVESLGNLAANLHGQGKYAEALKLFEEVLLKKTRVFGPEDDSTLATMSNLAVNLDTQGKLIEAEKLHRKALEIKRRKYGEQNPSTLTTMNNLAVTLNNQKRHADAEALYRQVLAATRRILGPEHPETLGALNNLAVNLGAQGKRAEASALLEELAATLRRLLSSEHPSTITAMNNLAMTWLEQGRNAEVQRSLSQTAEIAARSLGAEHPTTSQVRENLAQSLINQRKFAEAEENLRKVLEARRRVLGKDHEKTLGTLIGLAAVVARLGKYAESQKLNEEALEACRRVFGPEHLNTLLVMNQLAGMHLIQGHYSEASKGFSDLLAIVRRLHGRESADVVHVMCNFGGALAKEGKIAEARAVFEEVSTIQRQVLGPKHADTLAVDEILAALRQGRSDRLVPGVGRPSLSGH